MGLCKEARKVRLKVRLDRGPNVGADGAAALKKCTPVFEPGCLTGGKNVCKTAASV